jgi:AraC-like DNA-binding protein
LDGGFPGADLDQEFGFAEYGGQGWLNGLGITQSEINGGSVGEFAKPSTFLLPDYAPGFSLKNERRLPKCPRMRKSPAFSTALPVPESLFRESVYATHAGWERIEPNFIYPPPRAAIYFFQWEEGRVLPEFCLSFCAEGGGHLDTERGRQEIRPGDAYLFRPGEWHRHRPDPATGWVNLWLHFNGDLPHEWMRDEAFQLSGNIAEIEDRDLFQRQFERLLDSIGGNAHLNSAAVSWQTLGLLSHFVVDISAAERRAVTESDSIARRASEFIMNHTHTNIDVAEVAAHVGCGRRTLETHFRNYTGRSVLEEIQHCRAARAKSLLEETDMPMKQIIHRAGFQSREHMRLVFKKLLGVTPGSIRRPRGTPPQ